MASKFTDAQKAFILKQGVDGVTVAEICRKAGISQATYFNWKRKYDALLPTEMRRLRQLEEENSQLKRIVDVVLDFSMPGKPTDNAFIEAFNVRFRAECLNAHCFLSLDDAREKLEARRTYYNEQRPHGAIGYKTPMDITRGSRIVHQQNAGCPGCGRFATPEGPRLNPVWSNLLDQTSSTRPS